jgi:hypothetical protein
MGSGLKKNQIDMGNYIQSEKEQEAYMWCIRNNIFIAPKPKSATEWFLEITINGNKNVSPSAYKKNDIWLQLYKFYIYYYDKYANKLEVATVEDPKDKTKTKQKTDENSNNFKLF